MGINFSVDEEAIILDSIDDFIKTDVVPHAHALEYSDTYPSEIVEKMKELGFAYYSIGRKPVL